MTRRIDLVALLFAIAIPVAVHGCADDFVINNAPLCNPRTVHACTCNTGVPGQQLCHDDGRGYGACECLDGGVSPADAEVDAAPSNEGALVHER